MSASLLTSVSRCAATEKIDDSDMIGSHMIKHGGSARCIKLSRGADKGTKQCSFVAIYATTPIWPSFREASKHRFKSPTYATKEASYVCQCQSLGRLPLIWASPTSPCWVQQGLPDTEGRGQSRRGLRPSPPNCKAVEGVRSEATVSLAHIPRLRSQESSQRVSDNPYYIINLRIIRAKFMWRCR